jgi:hypothetical protein
MLFIVILFNACRHQAAGLLLLLFLFQLLFVLVQLPVFIELALFSDVLALARLMYLKVLVKFGVSLECEVQGIHF